MKTFLCFSPLSLLIYLASGKDREALSRTQIIYYSQHYERTQIGYTNSTLGVHNFLTAVCRIFSIDIIPTIDQNASIQLSQQKIIDILNSAGLKPNADDVQIISSGFELLLPNLYQSCETVVAHGAGADLLDFVDNSNFIFHNLRNVSSGSKIYYGGIYCERIKAAFSVPKSARLVEKHELYAVINSVSNGIPPLLDFKYQLLTASKHTPIILYYPTSAVEITDYPVFLLSELKALAFSQFTEAYSLNADIKLLDYDDLSEIDSKSAVANLFANALVLIMPSKSDNRNYDQMWKSLGFRVLSLPPECTGLPMEFFLDLPLWFLGDIGTARFTTGRNRWVTSKRWPRKAFLQRYNYEKYLLKVFESNDIGIDFQT
jgi:hypothetical protein